MSKPLTPAAFDTVTGVRKPEKLWGAPAIAKALGLSVDAVYSLARRPDSPIYRPSGRYFARRSELDAWLRTKPPVGGDPG